MPDFLKKSISSINIRILLICLFVLVTGITAGIFFGGLLPDNDILHLIPLLENQASTSGPVNLPAALINLAYLLLICFAGFTLYGFPLSLFLLLIRGFATGFCDCLLLYSINTGELLNFIISFLLPQLLLCTVYLIATAYAVSHALSAISSKGASIAGRNSALNSKRDFSDDIFNFFIFYGALTVAVFLLSLFV